MAGLQLGEKQLFEKFWKGTFKAVATPRPESIIVASITARRTAAKLETSVCLEPKDDETKPDRDATTVAGDRNGQAKSGGRKRHRRHRHRCVSVDADHSPWPAPKSKKKKKKSDRKRRRERSPSCSPSPVRKKRKKKSSKKRKHRRSASKKRRHSASTSRHKRKEERKHKKRSRSDARRRRRYRATEAESPAWRSSSVESRNEVPGSEEHAANLGGDVRPSVNPSGCAWRSARKLAPKMLSVCHGNPSENPSKGGVEYDSGNDTSSPPSSKTGMSGANDGKKVACQELQFTDGDNVSDSGNSVTSYASLSKPAQSESHLSATTFDKCRVHPSIKGPGGVTGPRTRDRSRTSLLPLSRPRDRSHSSRSRSGSSRTSTYSEHHTHSPSLYSGRRSYSRSLSCSSDSRRESVCSFSSRGSTRHCRYTPERLRKRESSSCERDSKRSRKRSRRKPYSPMRKRRRDSPSHLEARRITSARKRPIPYYRPSPSSSSRSSSLSSWSSLFSRSRSRSRSFSSYRSYSRSSSLNSIFGGGSRSRSRSRSYDFLASYGRARR